MIMKDFPEKEMKIMADEYKRLHLPNDVEEKTVKELRKLGLFKMQPFFRGKVFKLISVAAFFVVVFSLGFFTGRIADLKRAAVPGINADKYLLLLYNPPGFAESGKHAKEYGDWLDSINGVNTDGEELEKSGWMIALNDGQPLVSALSPEMKATGFFVIDATSEEEALATAKSCPHVKHNGVVEVRVIHRH